MWSLVSSVDGGLTSVKMGDFISSRLRESSFFTALGMLIVVISLVTLWIAEILPRTLLVSVPGAAPVLDLFFLSFGSYVVFVSGGIRQVAFISVIVSSFTIILSVGLILLSTVGGCGSTAEPASSFVRKSQFAAVLTAVTSVLQICLARVFCQRDISLSGGHYGDDKETLNRYECLGSTLLGFGTSAIFFLIFIHETANSNSRIKSAEDISDCIWSCHK